MTMHLLGIRHHGPGCARGLRAVLDELQPDCLAIEGPADAVPLAGHADMRPPVALLVYPPDDPKRAAYFPFAEFSPEWQALRWALGRGVPVRLIDLPQANRMAMEAAGDTKPPAQNADEETGEDGEGREDDTQVEPAWRGDPIGMLAEAAGYADRELWWEEQIERHGDAAGLFAAIADAMRAVREYAPEIREIDLTREAFMRQSLRAVRKEAFETVAVVCGAWHVPALDEECLTGKRPGCAIKDDTARLKGLPKVKTVATWIPWTFDRLTYRSGYGAGVQSPGWYEQLWTSPADAGTRWVATAARLLRSVDLDASSASVIEAVRLADALAALRDVRAAGLAELNEAIQTVLCHGETAPLRLIRDRLEIGDRLGETPAETPTVPLVADLQAQQKSLRLKPSASLTPLDLDLRTPGGLARSRLLHRLTILGLSWGVPQGSGGRASTFHEFWQLRWKPEFAVAAIEANVWGNTIAAAASARVAAHADEAADLPALTGLLDAAVLAGLEESVPPLLARLQARGAVAADVRHLLEALPPLARVARYGDVRGTRAGDVLPIARGLFTRALVGLRPACSGLDDDAAERMLAALSTAREALDLLDRPELTDDWFTELARLADGQGVHGLLRGWCVRQLSDAGQIDAAELERLTRLALSPAADPAGCAAWGAGLLRGSGLSLLHRGELWPAFDAWLAGLSAEAFIELLPALRRAFADFTPAERRAMGQTARDLRTASTPDRPAAPSLEDIDPTRAARVLPVLRHLLGTPP